jgi:hypothetical protein
MMTKNPILYGLTLVTLLLVKKKKSDVPKGFPKLHPVTLELVQGETPLTEATVSLYPMDASNQWSSGGFSDGEGRAVLRTHGGHNGVPEGKYRVAVVKAISDGIPATMDEPGTLATFSLIEKEYTLRQTTPLEVEVQAKKNNFRLDVGTPVQYRVQ